MSNKLDEALDDLDRIIESFPVLEHRLRLRYRAAARRGDRTESAVLADVRGRVREARVLLEAGSELLWDHISD